MKNIRSLWLRALGLAPLLALLATATAFAADEYVPVNEAARKATDPNPYIIGAYGFIWVAVLVYVVMVARGLGRAKAEVEELRKKLDARGR